MNLELSTCELEEDSQFLKKKNIHQVLMSHTE